MDTSVAVNDGSSANPVPQGFSVVTGPDNREYLVPDFLAADLQSAWERERTRELIGADVAARGPNPITNEPCIEVAEGAVQIPSDPAPSDREALNLHAEVLTMQARWGLSYKDAAHRLYMAEVEKLRVQKEAEHAFRALRKRVDKIITHEICPALAHIDTDRKSGN